MECDHMWYVRYFFSHLLAFRRHTCTPSTKVLHVHLFLWMLANFQPHTSTSKMLFSILRTHRSINSTSQIGHENGGRKESGTIQTTFRILITGRVCATHCTLMVKYVRIACHRKNIKRYPNDWPRNICDEFTTLKNLHKRYSRFPDFGYYQIWRSFARFFLLSSLYLFATTKHEFNYKNQFSSPVSRKWHYLCNSILSTYIKYSLL